MSASSPRRRRRSIPPACPRRVIVAAGGLIGLMAGIGFAVLIAIGRLFREISKGALDGRGPADTAIWRLSRRYRARALRPTGAVRPKRRSGAFGTRLRPHDDDGSLSIDEALARRRSDRRAGASHNDETFEALRPSVAADAAEMRRERARERLEGEDTQAASTDDDTVSSPTGYASDTVVDASEHDDPSDPSGEEPEAPKAGAQSGNVPTARRSLRDRVRAIAAERSSDGAAAALANDPEVARLQQDIAQAKQHIASIRSRRGSR